MAQPRLAEREDLGAGPLTPRYDEALAFAAEHHRTQVRKHSRIPYLSHLMAVSSLVLENGGSEDAAIAGLLHDAVEDAPDGEGPRVLADIEAAFGPDVAATVRACSDGLDAAGHRSGTWAERKIPYIEALPHKPFDAALVSAADKTHNARCIADDVQRYGPEFWDVFNACRHQLAWYYASVRAGLGGPLVDSPIVDRLDSAVTALLLAADVPEPALGAVPAPCGCPT